MNAEVEKFLRTIPKNESETDVPVFGQSGELALFALQDLITLSGFRLVGNWQSTAQAACENPSLTSIPLIQIEGMSYYGECGKGEVLIRVTLTLHAD